jgi:hypothetical protein
MKGMLIFAFLAVILAFWIMGPEHLKFCGILFAIGLLASAVVWGIIFAS